MAAFDDDDDRSAGSQDGSSDNDGDETMRDIDDGDDQGDDEDDNDADIDGDGDGDGDDDGEDEGDGDGDGDGEGEGDGEGGEDDEGEGEGSQGSDNERHDRDPDEANETQEGLLNASQIEAIKGLAQIPNLRPEILSAVTYDIIPTIAAPQSTSINAICSTADSRWVFTGGGDGYIRQYNWVDSVNAKLALTVAQRHPFVDSVVKAGVLMTYWENWDIAPGAKRDASQSSDRQQVLSPVYSLASQSQALWLLSGTASGAIRLQSVRHDEGKEIAILDQHKSAVSVLTVSSDERSLLSGSWDKTVLDWDLDMGKVRTTFAAAAGQISSIQSRPISSLPVPAESGEIVQESTTFTSNNDAAPVINGLNSRAASPPPPQKVSTPDSLFGGDDADDDLFGDGGGGIMGNGDGGFGYEEDEMTRAMANDTHIPDSADHTMADYPEDPPDSRNIASPPKDVPTSEPPMIETNGVPNTSEQPLANGLPHAEDMETKKEEITMNQPEESDRPITSDSTFLATSIDGAIRVWDRRQPAPVARIIPRNTPLWCLSACWSLDGNNIYAGRRNNTVEEYDLRKGLKGPERVFRFPNGSGAVTSVKAMPNGRHLICASYDILRLYDLKQPESTRSSVPFLIVPGHRTGVISHLYMDSACRFLMSTGGNRGWEGTSTEVLLGYEINVPNS